MWQVGENQFWLPKDRTSGSGGSPVTNRCSSPLSWVTKERKGPKRHCIMEIILPPPILLIGAKYDQKDTECSKNSLLAHKCLQPIGLTDFCDPVSTPQCTNHWFQFVTTGLLLLRKMLMGSRKLGESALKNPGGWKRALFQCKLTCRGLNRTSVWPLLHLL